MEPAKLIALAEKPLSAHLLDGIDWKLAKLTPMLYQDVGGKSLLQLVGEALAADEKLLWGVVHNAGRHHVIATSRWSAVMEAVGCGSTMAKTLCERFGADPDETVGGLEEQP